MGENPDRPEEEEVIRLLIEARAECGIGGITTDPALEGDRALHVVLLKLEEDGKVESCYVADQRVEFFWWQLKDD